MVYYSRDKKTIFRTCLKCLFVELFTILYIYLTLKFRAKVNDSTWKTNNGIEKTDGSIEVGNAVPNPSCENQNLYILNTTPLSELCLADVFDFQDSAFHYCLE